MTTGFTAFSVFLFCFISTGFAIECLERMDYSTDICFPGNSQCKICTGEFCWNMTQVAADGTKLYKYGCRSCCEEGCREMGPDTSSCRCRGQNLCNANSDPVLRSAHWSYTTPSSYDPLGKNNDRHPIMDDTKRVENFQADDAAPDSRGEKSESLVESVVSKEAGNSATRYSSFLSLSTLCIMSLTVTHC